MKVTLPKAVLDSLPSPDSEGLVRCNASLRLGTDGDAELVEINDHPMPVGESKESNDDDNPMPESDLPDLGSVEKTLY